MRCLRLPLLLGGLATGTLALQDLLTVLVELQLGDDDLGGGNRDGDGLSVALLANNCSLCQRDSVREVDQGNVLPLTWMQYLRR